MTESNQLKIRPYARLLAMLGDQLIKNERIALVELIKNAYDADSPWVKVSFDNFGDGFKVTLDSKIIIEDAGDGMNLDTIKNHWLNPATPDKKRRKEEKEKTARGRVIQGEKGIGRFSILKLGKKIKIITRKRGENSEYVIDYDFSIYDDEFLLENGKEKNIYIDEIPISIQDRKPEVILESTIMLDTVQLQRPLHGTRIEISCIKGTWSSTKIENVYNDIARLESIFSNASINSLENMNNRDFEVYICKDGKIENDSNNYLEKLISLLENQSVLRIENGIYNDKAEEFQFILNGVSSSLKLRDHKVKALYPFRNHFKIGGKVLDEREIECGPFQFGFFIFDFSNKAPSKYKLQKTEKDIIKNHRIYLYRDGIRVYPYGEPDDDWLHIDALRGTVSTGQFLSNDQVVGYVNITQKNNPKLKDKTSREGLIEDGEATEDFIALLQVFLSYIREYPYKIYQKGLENKNVHEIYKKKQVQLTLDELKEATKDDKKVHELVSKVESNYKVEYEYLNRRAEATEELAGVGLSVETASHDIMAIMDKAMMSIDNLIRDGMYEDIDQSELSKELQSLRGMLSFIEAQLKDIQLLFKSAKQRRKIIKVKLIVEKVERIYRRLLKKEGIELSINEIGSPLVARTTDAVLLQLLLNLFDNSVFWLQQISINGKRIEILLNGDRGQMIFSDNGPGVEKEYVPYIFEPFFSGKGEEGRGLGLYIARQLLERHDYSIELADLKSDKILPGANFVVTFVAEGD